MKYAVMTGLCLLVSVNLVQAGSQSPSVEVTLARDGQPAATIVIATNATRAAQFAAYELQYHVKKITGAVLPIAAESNAVAGSRILVGESRATQALGLKSADFQPQEYLIRFGPMSPISLILMGRDKEDRAKVDYATGAGFPGYLEEQGTCYAVYDFLERFCDVRWYLPTELGLVCPSNGTLTVRGGEVRRAPAMKWRYALPEYQIPGDLCGDTIKGATPSPVLAAREQALWWRRQRIGGEPYSACHSFGGYFPRFLETNNPALFEAAHPEYFAQGYPGRPEQMCFSSTGLVNQVAKDADEFFDGKKAKIGTVAAGDYFSVIPLDSGAWCKCADCAGRIMKASIRAKDQFSNDTASDYIYHFVNQIAGKVHEKHADKFIAALAYSDYTYPPSVEKLAPNVSIQLALHARMVYAPKIRVNDRKLLKLWVNESKDRRKFLWLYYCFPSMNASIFAQYRCFPGFFAHHVVTQMATWHKAGVRGMMYEPSYLPNDQRSILFDQLEGYVTWKLADDPTLDGNRLIEEFFTRYYGAAAKPMKAFYNRVEEIYCDPANYPANGVHQTETIAWGSLGTEARMKELGKFMEQARAAASTPIEKQRVALFDKGIWQYMLKGRASFLEIGDVTLQAARAPRIPEPATTNLAALDWSKAGMLTNWLETTGKKRADKHEKQMEGRLLHDGKNLYIRLQDLMDPKQLTDRGNIWGSDELELFFSRQRTPECNQIGIHFKGHHIEYQWPGQKVWDSGVSVVSDLAQPDRWVVYLAFPLDRLVPGGVKAGDKFYMNVIRSMEIGGKGAVSWNATLGGFRVPERLGEITLEPSRK